MEVKRMYSGPDDTFFCRAEDIPQGWQWRGTSEAAWNSWCGGSVSLPNLWVQVRRYVEPPPRTLTFNSMDQANMELGGGALFVLWKDMQDRGDLTRWERRNMVGRWVPLDRFVCSEPYTPLIVRRRKI